MTLELEFHLDQDGVGVTDIRLDGYALPSRLRLRADIWKSASACAELIHRNMPLDWEPIVAAPCKAKPADCVGECKCKVTTSTLP